jgi:hypothetical protein
VIVKPETVIRWHRAGFRLFWRWKSRSRGGRLKASLEIRRLIRAMSLANPFELLTPRFVVLVLIGTQRVEWPESGWTSSRTRALLSQAPGGEAAADGPNERWSLDFVADTLSFGRRFGILCIVDDFTREALALVVDIWIPRNDRPPVTVMATEEPRCAL